MKSDRNAETLEALEEPEAWDEEDGKSNKNAEGIERAREGLNFREGSNETALGVATPLEAALKGAEDLWGVV